MKTTILGIVELFQSLVLLLAGAATLWWSEDLMLLLISLVGEETALGAQNVIRLENGGKLLTNPGAMLRWMMPFWFLGLVALSAALTLGWRGYRSLTTRSSSVGCVCVCVSSGNGLFILPTSSPRRRT